MSFRHLFFGYLKKFKFLFYLIIILVTPLLALSEPIDTYVFVGSHKEDSLSLELRKKIESILSEVLKENLDESEYNLLVVPPCYLRPRPVARYIKKHGVSHYINCAIEAFDSGVLFNIELVAGNKKFSLSGITLGKDDKDDVKKIKERLKAVPIFYEIIENGFPPDKIVFIHCFSCNVSDSPIKACDLTVELPYRLAETNALKEKYFIQGMNREEFVNNCNGGEKSPQTSDYNKFWLDKSKYVISGDIFKADASCPSDSVKINVHVEDKNPPDYRTLSPPFVFESNARTKDIADYIAPWIKEREQGK